MRSYKTEAIVLKRIDVGEVDRIVTLFTKQYGKISVLGKGVRRITSRRAPHLEVFNYTSLFLAKGKSIDIIVEAETIRNFARLRESLSLAATSFWLIEEVERLCAERQKEPVLFDALIDTLTQLAYHQLDHKNIERLRQSFSLFLLWELGYLPRNRVLVGEALDRFIEQVLERKLISRMFY